jgi:rod shape determining protein RodA
MLRHRLRINYQGIRNFDWFIFSIPIVLTLLGIMTIYSATRSVLDIQPSFYVRQSIWLVLSIIALFVSASFDYRKLIGFAYHLYGIGLILLFLTILLGHTGLGAQRWLSIGSVSFQPSEMFRIAIIIVVAKYLSLKRSPLSASPLITLLFLFLLLPFCLLYKQPDLGTAITLVGIVVLMVLVKGVQRRILVSVLLIIIISIPFAGNLMWEGLKEYQRNRLVAFIDPQVDPKGIGYQIEQSKITIGSGKIFGKGYLKGTQGPFRFLPEKHTDFIFSVFSEEWGAVGSVVVISLYLLLIIRGYETAFYAKDEFGTLLSIGISTMFLLYVFINIGMTMGLMPVVGIPLPFFSYGGTALLANFICVGLLINVRMRRFILFY